MKKKAVVLVLAAALMLSACGQSESTEVETNVDVEAEVEVEAETDVDVEAEVEVEAETDVEAEVEAETEVETEEVEAEETASDYVKGISTETGWESEWLGLRFIAPEGMIMSTEEELNETMGLGQELLSEDFSEQQMAYAELVSVYEMMCYDGVGTNVIVMAEKLPMTLTAEQYVEVLSEQITNVTTIAYEVVSSGEVITLGGQDFVKLSCTAGYEGTALCQDYCVAVIDDRAVVVTLTYTEETSDSADAILNGFAAY